MSSNAMAVTSWIICELKRVDSDIEKLINKLTEKLVEVLTGTE